MKDRLSKKKKKPRSYFYQSIYIGKFKYDHILIKNSKNKLNQTNLRF